MLRLTLSFALVLALSSCSDGLQGELPPPPAEILRVEVSPLPVTPGDTVTFRAITSRPVNQYVWTVLSGERIESPGNSSVGNTMRWRAPGSADTYPNLVSLYEAGYNLGDMRFDTEVVND